MYGHFRFWRGEEFDHDDVPLFYADATDEMGELVEALSRDATAVARALETHGRAALDLRGVVPVHEWLREAYPHATADQSSAAACFRTGPLQMRRAPMTEIAEGRFVPDFEYRYLSEDIPYGLVVTRAVAEIAGVGTPAIDEVIRWGQWRLDKEYLSADGSLTGSDVPGLPIPQNHGIATLDDLIAWYGQRSAAPLRRPSVAAPL